jgi:hypothetical protein
VEENDAVDGGDVAGESCGLFVGEVPGAAHDALLEVFGAVGGEFEAGAVVALEGEGGDSPEVVGEIGGGSSEVGGVAEVALPVVEADAESGSAEGIVRDEVGEHADAGRGAELVAEGLGAMVQEPFSFGAAEVPGVHEDGRVFGERGEEGGVGVVGVEVSEDDGEDGEVVEAGGLEEGTRPSARKAAVDEEEACGENDGGAVAGGTAAEDAE